MLFCGRGSTVARLSCGGLVLGAFLPFLFRYISGWIWLHGSCVSEGFPPCFAIEQQVRIWLHGSCGVMDFGLIADHHIMLYFYIHVPASYQNKEFIATSKAALDPELQPTLEGFADSTLGVCSVLTINREAGT